MKDTSSSPGVSHVRRGLGWGAVSGLSPPPCLCSVSKDMQLTCHTSLTDADPLALRVCPAFPALIRDADPSEGTSLGAPPLLPAGISSLTGPPCTEPQSALPPLTVDALTQMLARFLGAERRGSAWWQAESVPQGISCGPDVILPHSTDWFGNHGTWH